jgi:hypothetical protein
MFLLLISPHQKQNQPSAHKTIHNIAQQIQKHDSQWWEWFCDQTFGLAIGLAFGFGDWFWFWDSGCSL